MTNGVAEEQYTAAAVRFAASFVVSRLREISAHAEMRTLPQSWRSVHIEGPQTLLQVEGLLVR